MSEGKTVRIDRTNAVIVDQENKIIENGIHLRCPHCGKALLHNRETVNIWTVGAIEQRVCCKCRKNFKTLSLTVPRGMQPESLYNRILCVIPMEEPVLPVAGSTFTKDDGEAYIRETSFLMNCRVGDNEAAVNHRPWVEFQINGSGSAEEMEKLRLLLAGHGYCIEKMESAERQIPIKERQ